MIRIGTVSADTMRPQDLLPRFSYCLLKYDPENVLAKEVLKKFEIDNREVYLQSEEADWDLSDLFEELGNLCKDYPYVYFGSTEGDGADYGFWVDYQSFMYDLKYEVFPVFDDNTDCTFLPEVGDFVLKGESYFIFYHNGKRIWMIE
jgi:hypothetical protein